jgi:hypothetical protein
MPNALIQTASGKRTMIIMGNAALWSPQQSGAPKAIKSGASNDHK